MGKGKKNIKQKDISLLDLFIEIMLQWRMLIILLLIGGMLFVGLNNFMTYNSIKTHNANREQALKQQNDEKLDSETLKEQLTDIQINNVETVLMYNKMLEDRIAYSKESFFMNFVSTEVVKGEVTWLIKSEDWEHTYNVQKIYEDIVTSTELHNFLKEECDINYNLSELVALEKSSYGNEYGTDTVRIQILHNDIAECEKIENGIISFVQQQNEKLIPILGEHEVIVITQSRGIILSEPCLEEQKAILAEINGLQSNIVKLQDAFSKDEWNYYNSFITTEETLEEGKNESLVEELTFVPSFSIKFFVVGALLFALIGVFYIFARYIMNKKIRLLDNLDEMFGIHQLGIIEIQKSKKKIFGFIDKWIMLIRDRNRRKFTKSEAITMAAVAVKMAVKKAMCNNVYFVGCDVQNQTKEVCEELKSVLKQDNIQVQIVDNMLYNAESLATLEDAKCVVLIEKVGSTMYDEILKELEIMSRQDINVLGGIIVE